MSVTWDPYHNNSYFKEQFELEWQGASDIQKIWFFARFEEMKRISRETDKLKKKSENSQESKEREEKDIIKFRIFLVILAFILISSLILIDDLRYFIISLVLCYLIFKFSIFFTDINEYDFQHKVKLRIQASQDFWAAERYIMNNTPIGDDFMRFYVFYGSGLLLEDYTKNSMAFRYELLRECRESSVAAV